MNGYRAPPQCLLAKQRTWREHLPLSPQACHYWTPAVVGVFGTGPEDDVDKRPRRINEARGGLYQRVGLPMIASRADEPVSQRI